MRATCLLKNTAQASSFKKPVNNVEAWQGKGNAENDQNWVKL